MDTLVFVHIQDSCQDLMICFAYPIRLLDGYLWILWVINGYHMLSRCFPIVFVFFVWILVSSGSWSWLWCCRSTWWPVWKHWSPRWPWMKFVTSTTVIRSPCHSPAEFAGSMRINQDHSRRYASESLWFQNVSDCFSKSARESCGNPHSHRIHVCYIW